jgi:hypothetical protein
VTLHRSRVRRVVARAGATADLGSSDLALIALGVLLERLAARRAPESSMSVEEQLEQANGWGQPCTRGPHRDGCTLAGGWEIVAFRGLSADEPRLWRPIDPDAWLGPPPPCYHRLLREWYRLTPEDYLPRL